MKTKRGWLLRQIGETLRTRKGRQRLSRQLGVMLCSLIAGVFVPLIFDEAFKTELIRGQNLHIVVGLAIAVLLCLMVLYLHTLLDALQHSTKFDLHLSRDVYVDGTIRRVAFSTCNDVALRAKKRIVVIGPHFDKKGSEGDTTSHDLYLESALTAAVERHAIANNRDFVYERIVQIGREEYIKSREAARFSLSNFNNQSMAKHIQTMLDIRKKYAIGHRISVVARPYIASFPSILIVDDHYVFFSLPTDPADVDGAGIAYDTVLCIEDDEGGIAGALSDIVLRFKDESFAIREVS